MEYAREFDGIQAGFALNAGKLLLQYREHALSLPSNRQYEATLAVCVLQSLLTNCSELIKYMESDDIQREFFDQVIGDEGPAVWGITKSFIVENEFPGPLTVGALLEHLRNAVSHPCPDKEFEFDPTGYTTTNDPSERVTAFRFTDSPWVKTGKRHYKGRLPVARKRDAEGRIKQFHQEYDESDFLNVLPLDDGTYELGRHGVIFWPTFTMELPLAALMELARGLANHLAHHTDANWDRRTIRELLA